MCPPLVIRSFHQYLSNIYFTPGIELIVLGTVMKRTGKVSVHCAQIVLGKGKITDQEVNTTTSSPAEENRIWQWEGM